jgi:hypothetical protein
MYLGRGRCVVEIKMRLFEKSSPCPDVLARRSSVGSLWRDADGYSKNFGINLTLYGFF